LAGDRDCGVGSRLRRRHRLDAPAGAARAVDAGALPRAARFLVHRRDGGGGGRDARPAGALCGPRPGGPWAARGASTHATTGAPPGAEAAGGAGGRPGDAADRSRLSLAWLATGRSPTMRALSPWRPFPM